MMLIWLCRYLCFMFCVLSMASMSATVAPGQEAFATTCRVVVLVLAVVSGTVSVVLRRLYAKDPNHPVVKSKLALAVAMIVALLGTMLLGG